MPKAPGPTAEAKTLRFCEAFSSFFLMVKSYDKIIKYDRIVVSTLEYVTISDKFLKRNGIRNRKVSYWQKLL